MASEETSVAVFKLNTFLYQDLTFVPNNVFNHIRADELLWNIINAEEFCVASFRSELIRVEIHCFQQYFLFNLLNY
jgi:hypothetical protein